MNWSAWRSSTSNWLIGRNTNGQNRSKALVSRTETHCRRMLQPEEMKAKAEQCERMADRATGRLTAYILRELAGQWREMALQLDVLEHSSIHKMLGVTGAVIPFSLQP